MVRNELSNRLFDFARDTILFLRKIPETTEYKVIKYQLVKSSGSAGANYEEAQSGSSSADFKYKVEISLREMKESNYWLRLIAGISEKMENQTSDKVDELIDESDQLSKILGTIVVKVKSKMT